jgi:hypothetical protein
MWSLKLGSCKAMARANIFFPLGAIGARRARHSSRLGSQVDSGLKQRLVRVNVPEVGPASSDSAASS